MNSITMTSHRLRQHSWLHTPDSVGSTLLRGATCSNIKHNKIKIIVNRIV
ncbi:MAG: hypothetical protein U9P70_03970 [Patescibacteria group bacterium]|nr:hypothetical protein [Patescibacteria group bacterium]